MPYKWNQVGSAVGVNPAWTTGLVLRLFEKDTTVMVREVGRSIVRFSLLKNVLLNPRFPTWTAEVFDGFSYIAWDSALAFADAIDFGNRKRVLKVRLYVTPSAWPERAAESNNYQAYKFGFSRFLNRSELEDLLKGDKPYVAKEPHAPHPDSWNTPPYASWTTDEELYHIARSVADQERLGERPIEIELGSQPQQPRPEGGGQSGQRQ